MSRKQPSIEVGAPVAVLDERGRSVTARLTTITRLTSTQVIVPGVRDGTVTRFRRDSLREVGQQSSGSWFSRTMLCAPDDPAVLAALAREVMETAVYKFDALRRNADRSSPSQVRALLAEAAAIFATAAEKIRVGEQ